MNNYFLQEVAKHIACPTDDMNQLVTCLKVSITLTFPFQFIYVYAKFCLLHLTPLYFLHKLEHCSRRRRHTRRLFWDTASLWWVNTSFNHFFSIKFSPKIVLWAQPICSLPSFCLKIFFLVQTSLRIRIVI